MSHQTMCLRFLKSEQKPISLVAHNIPLEVITLMETEVYKGIKKAFLQCQPLMDLEYLDGPKYPSSVLEVWLLLQITPLVIKVLSQKIVTLTQEVRLPF